MPSLKKTFVWVLLFALAMGFMESAVVVYLRELYYKNGFQFPLQPITPFIGRVEFVREIATVIMLLGIGIVAGRSPLQRFAWFVFSFAIWDLAYYLFLYICLGWPASLSTWDILFLVPMPWVGPVWAPCLLCMLMIAGSVFVIKKCAQDPRYRVSKSCWTLLIGGALVCILAFMWDYLQFALSTGKAWSLASSDAMFAEISDYVPRQFNHALFLSGFLLMGFSVTLSIFKTKQL